MSPTSADTHNIQLLNRQIEISEWTYNDRMETLFIFQILFIALMIVAILFYMRGAGLLGKAFVGYAVSLLLLVVVIIIVNRSMYTARSRDKRTWNRRDFQGDNAMPSTLTPDELATYVTSVKGKYGVVTAAECPASCQNSSTS